MPHPSSPVILWFRKDLRLDDNLALIAACDSDRTILPLYIREPAKAGTGPLGSAQAWWLHHSLSALEKSLKRHGSRLVLRSGDALAVLAQIVEETGAKAVYWNRRYDPNGITVDTAVKSGLSESGIDARSFAGQLMHEPSRVKTGSGGPYRVYTPFWRALQEEGEPHPPANAPKSIPAPPHWPDSEELSDWKLLPTKPDWAREFSDIWTPGEDGARQRLGRFVANGLDGYEEGRDFPAQDSTSMLSPHLALGEISPARIWHSVSIGHAHTNADNVIKFRKELAWRDFSYHLLFHFPDLATRNWNPRFDDFEWRNDEERLALWQKGETGYPIVDAGMRQLWRHGTMHNRVRMIAASFLIKHLLIDWRHGERWFRDTLVDADPASNAASWQWVAGSGADASPFFRVFNPLLQGEKFDGQGEYVRQFVPELAKLDNAFIHKPFEAPAAVLKAAGIVLGKTYAKPIVDHRMARERALAAYKETSGD